MVYGRNNNNNSKLHLGNAQGYLSLSASVLSLPSGNHSASNLASTLQSVLQATFPNENYTCIYNTAGGSITISSISSFRVFTDDQVVEMTNNIGVQFPGWVDHNNQLITADINSLMSMLRHSEAMPAETTFESGFVDLLKVHNIYNHCPSLGHYSTVGVRGESSIIKHITVSSSFGYLIIDSVVSPHDKIYVSKQPIKAMHLTLKNVHANVINLHGAHVSLPLVFQTIE